MIPANRVHEGEVTHILSLRITKIPRNRASSSEKASHDYDLPETGTQEESNHSREKKPVQLIVVGEQSARRNLVFGT
jgi:hypothetical protein